MLEIDNSRFFFKTKEIWFSEVPYDITGYDGVTFHGCLKDVKVKGFSKEKFTTLVIDLTQDLDIIWKKIDGQSCRYSINKAIKLGVKVRLNQDYNTFNKINSEFRKLKGLTDYDIDVEFMKKNGLLFLSEFEGKIIGVYLAITDGKTIRGWIGASIRLEEGINNQLSGNSNRLIIWEIIKYAKERGMDTFDMGGYYTGKKPDSQKERINFFKKSFGGELVTQYIYQKDYSKTYSFAKWVYSTYNRLKSGNLKAS
jgi:hypothetical protein